MAGGNWDPEEILHSRIDCGIIPSKENLQTA